VDIVSGKNLRYFNFEGKTAWMKQRINRTYRAYRDQRKCRNSSGESPMSTIGLLSVRPSASQLPCGKENIVPKLDESFVKMDLWTYS